MLTKVFADYKWKNINCSLHGVEYKDIEVPAIWEESSIPVVVSKFFRVVNGVRETSFKQVVTRIVKTISDWGKEFGYFPRKDTQETFYTELAVIMIEQRAAFNSPVWFNFGVSDKPQGSACFILGVEDTMESILDTVKLEGMIFKGGSGSGCNLSHLRSSYEKLSGGGYASGPVSFMQPLDSMGGAVKSGGTTRRAASIRVLNIDHPDILELRNGAPGFITCKMEEDKKGRFLVENGFSNDLDTGVYASLQYQNANNSISVFDSFMQAVKEDKDWNTVDRNGNIVHTYKARFLMQKICESTWACGDPALQFIDTINSWNPVHDKKIESSNPCSEHLHVNFTACNLASLNLLKYYNKETKVFDVDRYCRDVKILITAMDIIVGGATYPDERFKVNSHKYRPLGLGYCNLGALFLQMGYAYGSVRSCMITELLTSLMTFTAFEHSATMASELGGIDPKDNEKVFCNIQKHISLLKCSFEVPIQDITNSLSNLSDIYNKLDALMLTLQDDKLVYRNTTTTLLAPTGTISFALGAESTGIEPLFTPVVYKILVGGGVKTMVSPSYLSLLESYGWKRNDSVDLALDIETFLSTLQGKPLDILRTAVGTHSISWQNHLNVMQAAQKYLSGGISKTVNVCESATIEDIQEIYERAWEMGLKSIAIYRDGSKGIQVLKTNKSDTTEKVLLRGDQNKLPKTCESVRHGFRIGQSKGWFHIGYYPTKDGKKEIGEIWVRMDNFGSTIDGMMDCFCRAVSYGLQYGIPLEKFVEAFWHMDFSPQGYTDDSEVRHAPSVPAYIIRKIALTVLPKEKLIELGLIQAESVTPKAIDPKSSKPTGVFCNKCGAELVQTGRCKFCPQCLVSSGSCD